MKSKVLCFGLVVLSCLTGVFAEFPGPVGSWAYVGLNANGTPNTNYTANITAPDITLSSSLPITSGGAQIIAAVYGGSISYTDTLLISSDVARNTGNSDCGILLNYNAGTMSGYLLTVGFKSGYLDIFKINSGVKQGLTQVQIADFNADVVYSLEFTYKAGHLTGDIFDGTTNKGSINVDDSTYTSGFVGVLASTTYASGGSDSTKAAFTNYDVSDVPEPVTVLLLGAGAVGMFIKRKRG